MNNPQNIRNPQSARQNVPTNPDMEQRRKLAEDLDAQGIYPPAWTTTTRAPWSRQAVYRQTGFHDSAKHFIANGELYERANNPALNPSPKQAAESLKAYLGQAAKPIHEIVPVEQVPLTHPVGRPMTPQSPEEAGSMAKLLAEQNVNHETWHQGDPVPPAMQKWIIANGYKTSDIYQGPDGWHYQRNERTLESPDVTKLRLAEAAPQTPQNAANVITGTNPDPANAKVAEKILADWQKAGAIPQPASSVAQPIAGISDATSPVSANDNVATTTYSSSDSSLEPVPLSSQSQAILAGMKSVQNQKPAESVELAQANSESADAKSESQPDNAGEPEHPLQQTSSPNRHPHITPTNSKEARKQCMIIGGGCLFDVKENPNAKADAPWFESATTDVQDNAKSIDHWSGKSGVDPDLVRAIMYVETSHGYYDPYLSALVAPFGIKNKSILPMNVNVAYWGDHWGTREELESPDKNIEAGTKMLSSIIANLPKDASIAQIATLYNSHSSDEVSDYGARVAKVYEQKPWLKVSPEKDIHGKL